MSQRYLHWLNQEICKLKTAGFYKEEHILQSPQQVLITTQDGQQVLNLCANNYLGLANHPYLIETAKKALSDHGYGMSSVRFICGTQSIHKALEARISAFLGTEDTILFSSCFDANTGLFEVLLNQNDAILSDTLNHASIIDGIRLCKAARFRYENNNMADLEEKLSTSTSANFRMIATDGVFSMNGTVANLPEICDLAETYDALVMVDDSHATGFFGPEGKGTPAHFGISNNIDVFTGTLGKALGGASGGYASGRKEIITWLRQRARPYLFSNSLAPVIAATSLKVFDLLEREGLALQTKLQENTRFFRTALEEAGFRIIPGEHPIIPIMLGEAPLAVKMADLLLKEGIYVVSFSYPVVPQHEARIRIQMSAGFEQSHLEHAIEILIKIGRQLRLIS